MAFIPGTFDDLLGDLARGDLDPNDSGFNKDLEFYTDVDKKTGDLTAVFKVFGGAVTYTSRFSSTEWKDWMARAKKANFDVYDPLKGRTVAANDKGES